jgi:ABC-type dipeptide/oligopeptide/nickel transport system ATPase component
VNNSTILQVENLKTVFSSRGQEVQAVRGVSFEVNKGEIVGLVGESGSGKSVTMKAILGILPENAKTSADILRFQDKDLISLMKKSTVKCAAKR